MAWENPLVHSSVMYRNIHGSKKVTYNSKVRYAQDYDFYLSYINKIIFIIKDYLSSNRKHSKSLTKSYKMRKLSL